MNNFWNNISRYPRFFVSSLIGSLLIILTPFKTLLKNIQLRSIFILIIFFLISLLYFIIKAMSVL